MYSVECAGVEIGDVGSDPAISKLKGVGSRLTSSKNMFTIVHYFLDALAILFLWRCGE